jgi:FMN phosphatase YigB (HAD superfamily)
MNVRVIFFDLGDTLIVTGQKWVPEAKNVLTQLHQRGLRLGLISNTADLNRAEFLKLLPADFDLSLFEASLIILSSEVHLEKPDPEIFKLALKRAAAAPESCLFCTEELLHTLVAQTVGMRTARLQPPSMGDIGTLVEQLVKAALLPA